MKFKFKKSWPVRALNPGQQNQNLAPYPNGPRKNSLSIRLEFLIYKVLPLSAFSAIFRCKKPQNVDLKQLPLLKRRYYDNLEKAFTVYKRNACKSIIDDRGRSGLGESYFRREQNKTDQVWGGGSNFPYILLNEIQTMFSQLAEQSSRQ